ncbi:MAG: sarcosine oxidase subunit gamma [Rhodospirillaceae bacterium]|nr:sarcosine oxidase subunit gamma [Rhodospirillaceae bacterium]
MAEIDMRRRAALPADVVKPVACDTAGIRLKQVPHLGKINLRLDAGDGTAAQALADLGVALPTQANTVAGGAGSRTLWLGPDEWLIVTPPGGEAALLAQATQALAGRHIALTDVTDNATTIGVAGPQAASLLAKGCPLDLHPAVFGLGRVAQSLIGSVDMILECTPDALTPGERAFLLHVRRSFARHVWDWLVDGAREYGLTVEG